MTRDVSGLAAIIGRGSKTRLLRIPLHQALQGELAASWQAQYLAFVKDAAEIDFNAGYQPEEHELFALKDYELPSWLEEMDSQSAPEVDPISQDGSLLDAARGIVAFACDEDGNELMLFQNFSCSHVIRPGGFLFLQGDTYETNQRPGLTLEGKLSAIYTADGKLIFNSFRTVNTFLPLADYYEEASEQEIKKVLSHKLLAPEDADALATGANQWFRKRFAMLRDSGVLDEYSAKAIQTRSKGYDIAIKVSKGQIIFPTEKNAAKKLLQFLNEELFRGAITAKLFETNSKRDAD